MADTATDKFLKHYGVPGMKWGRRKKYTPSVKINVRRANGSTKEVKTLHPSQLRPISKDAKNAETFSRIAKTQGTQALSNQQLQALVNRQNLERQYSQLNPKQISAGRQLANSLLNGAPGLVKVGMGAYKSMQPQTPKAAPSKDLALYSTPTAQRVAGQVLAAVGKQVVSQYGSQIGMAIVKSLLK